MKEVTLSTYLKLRKQSHETEPDKYAKEIFSETTTKPTDKAYEAKSMLDGAKPLLGAEEYINLTNETDLESLGVTSDEAKHILSVSSASISLSEYYKLKEEAKETVESKDFVDITTGERLISPTLRASAIQKLLASCSITLTPDEFKQLTDTSKMQELNNYAKDIFGETEMQYTNEALEAQKILASSKVNLSLNDFKQMVVDSTEQEPSSFPDFDGKPIMQKTDKAEMATSILGHSRVVLSSPEEYASLRNSIAKEIDFPSDYFPNMSTISYDNILAQYVFNHNVLLDFGARQKFTTTDIGKGTLDAQSDTRAKLQEEQSREELNNNKVQPLDIDFI